MCVSLCPSFFFVFFPSPLCVCVRSGEAVLDRLAQDMVAEAGNAAAQREGEVVVGGVVSPLLLLFQCPPPPSNMHSVFFVLSSVCILPFCIFSHHPAFSTSILHLMLTLQSCPPPLPPIPLIMSPHFSLFLFAGGGCS